MWQSNGAGVPSFGMFWDLVGSPEENKVCLNGEAQPGNGVGAEPCKTGAQETR